MDGEFEVGTKGGAPSFVDIRSQQRNGRKCLTLVTGIPSQFSLNKILKYLKKSLTCNGSIVVDEEYGAVLQLQGDKKREVAEFLVHEGIVDKEAVRVHATMRFGKKLALAMIRDAGEAPYVSQKALKHVLVGLEKLCKLYSDQEAIIAESRMDREELVTYINMERAKYGLSARDSIMDVMEVVDRDAEFFRILVDDVVQLRRYVEACEADIMEAVNEWLEAATSEGLIQSTVRRSHSSSKALAENPSDDQISVQSEAIEILNEFSRIKQYADVNTAAINKLIARRNKNVPECFWSVDAFPELGQILTNDSRDLASVVELVANLTNQPCGTGTHTAGPSTPSISLGTPR